MGDQNHILMEYGRVCEKPTNGEFLVASKSAELEPTTNRSADNAENNEEGSHMAHNHISRDSEQAVQSSSTDDDSGESDSEEESLDDCDESYEEESSCENNDYEDDEF